MTEQPAKNQIDLNGIGAANGCQELAAFDLSRSSQKLACLHYARFGQQPAEDEKQAAINGLETIVKIFLPAGQDAFVEIVGVTTSTKPFYGLLIFARRAGVPVGAAIFVKQCDTPAIAEQALHQLQVQTRHFREGAV